MSKHTVFHVESDKHGKVTFQTQEEADEYMNELGGSFEVTEEEVVRATETNDEVRRAEGDYR